MMHSHSVTAAMQPRRRTLPLVEIDYARQQDYLPGWTESISTGVFFLPTNEEHALGQRIRAALHFPDTAQPLVLEGIVVAHGDAPRGLGVRIESESARRRLARRALAATDVLHRCARCAPRFRVVVVEDNPFMQRACELVLQEVARSGRRRLDLVVCSDGAEALEVITQDPPDLVILDSEAPVLSGAALVSRLRAEAATAVLPILALGARGEEDRALLEPLGIDGFLPKPLRFGELLETIVFLIHLDAVSDVRHVC